MDAWICDGDGHFAGVMAGKLADGGEAALILRVAQRLAAAGAAAWESVRVADPDAGPRVVDPTRCADLLLSRARVSADGRRCVRVSAAILCRGASHHGPWLGLRGATPIAEPLLGLRACAASADAAALLPALLRAADLASGFVADLPTHLCHRLLPPAAWVQGSGDGTEVVRAAAATARGVAQRRGGADRWAQHVHLCLPLLVTDGPLVVAWHEEGGLRTGDAGQLAVQHRDAAPVLVRVYSEASFAAAIPALLAGLEALAGGIARRYSELLAWSNEPPLLPDWPEP